jgi:uncharacterized membrane protein
MDTMTPMRPGPTRRLTLLVALAGALTVLGLVALWPRGEATDLDGTDAAGGYVEATVVAVDGDVVTVRLTSGPDRGDEVDVPVADGEAAPSPELGAGDRIVLHDAPTAPERFRYSFAGYQRTEPLLWLAGAFVVLVLVVGRWQGLRALLGLVAGLAVLAVFLVPALLHGQPAVPVVLAGAAAVVFACLYLAHGFNLGTTVAVAGTLVSLALTSALALGAATAAQVAGTGAQDLVGLRVTAAALDLRGLLVAGIVVGALGALGDVTVRQTAIVAGLRRNNPGLPGRLVYRQATIVGRDHLSSTVTTLVLAYAGAALPLLLLFAAGGQPVARVVTGDLVAVVLVRMLVGAVGVVLAAPVTTALAAAVIGGGADRVGQSRRRIGNDPVADGGGPDGPPPAHVAERRGRRRRLLRRRREDGDRGTALDTDEEELAPAGDLP